MNMRFTLALVLIVFTRSALTEEPGLPDLEALRYLDTFPRAKLMAGVGNSHLKITTSSQQAQKYFDQGLSLLHCFWDFEALRAFREVVRLDPRAAMGYWGMYRALGFDPGTSAAQRKPLIEIAQQLSEKASQRERLYIRAEAVRNREDSDEYVRRLETLVDRFPNDVEAQLFLALGLMAGYDSKNRPREGQKYSQSILRNLLSSHPDHHGVHHYWVHAMETSSRPEEALESAHRLQKLAPNSGHIVHMAGHIYYQVGDYSKAYSAFSNSMQVDSAYMEQYGIEPVDTWNYIHNLDYLVANCAEDGRFAEGEKWARVLQDLKLSQPDHADQSRHFVSRRGQMRMARGKLAWAEFYLRFGDWSNVIRALESLSDAPELSSGAVLYRDQLLLYARSMEALDQDNLDEAEGLADALDAGLWQRSLKEEQDSKPSGFRETSMLTIFSLELRGQLAHKRGKTNEAIEWLERAATRRQEAGEGEPPLYVRPVEETLAYVQLEAQRYEAARSSFRKVLKMRPHSGHALFGIALSYQREGEQARAGQAYRDFLEAWKDADPDRGKVVHARQWLQENEPATAR